jgi:hypothetical protein
MFKYRIVITWNNDLTHTYHIKRKTPISFADFNLKTIIKSPETDGIIGLHITEMGRLHNAE